MNEGEKKAYFEKFELPEWMEESGYTIKKDHERFSLSLYSEKNHFTSVALREFSLTRFFLKNVWEYKGVVEVCFVLDQTDSIFA